MTPAASPAAPRAEASVADVRADVDRACAIVAPTWPLDRFIAVNPFWEMIDEPLPAVSSKLASLSGARLTMPRSWFRQEWLAGRVRDEDLEEAIARDGSGVALEDLHASMTAEEPERPRRARVTDVADSLRDLGHEASIRRFVVHATSQLCAAYFDDGQARLGPGRDGGLYETWRRQAPSDLAPALLLGLDGYRRAARALPRTASELFRVALRDLGVPPSERQAYLTSLLLDVGGWAAWCAYRRWTARLAGGDDEHIVDLLAVRLAWEWLLLSAHGSALEPSWRRAMAQWPAIDAAASAPQGHDWLLQRALEIAWQREACRGLEAGLRAPALATTEPVAVQAAFCIDVRSEVLRRALEAQSSGVRTLGFAGFFGIPVEYQPLGSASARPQLPGLLAPRLRVTDVGAPAELAARRSARLDVDAAWKTFKTTALSSFAFVESLGLVFGGDLLVETLGSGEGEAERAGLTPEESAMCKPRITARADGAAVGVEERCALAEGVLRAMGLTRGFARLVLLVGHGSRTRNNPHAAGLACGACCGQSGEVNARAAAALLNEPEVRRGLSARGVEIPRETRFVAGVHDTTTDEVTLHDLDELPASHAADVEALRRALSAASVASRRERAPSLGLAELSDAALRRALEDRARSWAEVRPEWGLANNAALVVAPRSRSRHLNLAGRAFLHDYRHEDDDGYAVLELLMTAPMVVAHWINLQYYASTVDNERYGSGNKVLHNVVGGHLGVFEGNGGDLRVGLPLQSLHDGERWVHTPLRLSVFVEAPRAAIEGVLAKHEKVRALVDNEWVHLFQLDGEVGEVRAYRKGAWA